MIGPPPQSDERRHDADLSQRLAHLLREAGDAHHRAFVATDGVDPEWPLWYAGYLHEPLARLLATPLTRSEIVYLLIAAERAHAVEAPERDWPEFYASYLLCSLARPGEAAGQETGRGE